MMLTSLAVNAGADPFAKVIKLLTDLRWRLEQEEAAEVKKQVWCEQNLRQAEHERDARYQQARTLSTEVERLEASIDSLVESVKRHAAKAVEIGESITEVFTDTSQLSEQQMHAMAAQKKARDEIKDAILILRSYYSGAARAGANAGDFLQKADPVDSLLKDYREERKEISKENEDRAADEKVRKSERTERARKRIGDLEGNYPSMNRQGSLGDAIGLMETIVSDFDREIGNIQGDLDAEHTQLVQTNQVLTSQKEKAEELRDLDKQGLKTDKLKKQVALDAMKTSINLLDGALMELENLKPTCISTGMSYDERVKMRDIEIAALKKSMCILGAKDEDSEYGC